MTTTEICSNCNAVIGRLETPFIHQGDIVCKACYDRLNASTSPAPKVGMNAGQKWSAILACLGVPFIMLGYQHTIAIGAGGGFWGAIFGAGTFTTLLSLLAFAFFRAR